MKWIEIPLAAVTVSFVATTVLTNEGDSATPTPTPTPSVVTEFPSPTPEVEIGVAVQARVRVVKQTCAVVITVVEQREGTGPWKVIDRRVRQRDACPAPRVPTVPVPTAIAGGM